jgi:uncharacterized protein (TIGR02466 family)
MKNTLLSFHYYQYTCPEVLTDNVLSIAQNSKWVQRAGYNKGISGDVLEHDELRSWINTCLADFKAKEFPTCRANIKATQIWLNKTQKMEMHHKHSHPNSVVSGILYLNSIEQGGNTVFYYPNPFWRLHNEGFLNLSGQDGTIELHHEVPAVKGNLILFPSTISHSVSPVRANTARYSVAFNTFFEGTLGSIDMATYLKL